MLHKTDINGTVYRVIGGKTKMDGTDYGIIGGSTLVNGTGYTIEFSGGQETVPDGMVGVSVRIFDPPCGCITIKGENISISEDGVYSYEPGTVVDIEPWGCHIYYDGVKVQDVNVYDHYQFTLTANVTIYSNYDNGGTIYIETE